MRLSLPRLRCPSRYPGTSSVCREEPDKGKETTSGAAATSGTLFLPGTLAPSLTSPAWTGKATYGRGQGQLRSSSADSLSLPPHRYPGGGSNESSSVSGGWHSYLHLPGKVGKAMRKADDIQALRSRGGWESLGISFKPSAPRQTM